MQVRARAYRCCHSGINHIAWIGLWQQQQQHTSFRLPHIVGVVHSFPSLIIRPHSVTVLLAFLLTMRSLHHDYLYSHCEFCVVLFSNDGGGILFSPKQYLRLSFVWKLNWMRRWQHSSEMMLMMKKKRKKNSPSVVVYHFMYKITLLAAKEREKKRLNTWMWSTVVLRYAKLKL